MDILYINLYNQKISDISNEIFIFKNILFNLNDLKLEYVELKSIYNRKTYFIKAYFLIFHNNNYKINTLVSNYNIKINTDNFINIYKLPVYTYEKQIKIGHVIDFTFNLEFQILKNIYVRGNIFNFYKTYLIDRQNILKITKDKILVNYIKKNENTEKMNNFSYTIQS